ncbi:class I tRNA ligase family protein [Micromonospora okii]|uniref:class I tRNA ligase family protein n=1 Tax=Micromonospora okii TaxID=1182970 RepID=UPI001E589655|nr:class I tRNA ligase family protein [Micromonospora okii]
MLVAGIPRSVSDMGAPTFVRSSPPPWADVARPPFNVTRVTLRPGETTAAHNHHDNEVWIILDGRGVVRFDDVAERVAAGDTVYLAPLGTHTLHNEAVDRPLTFLSVWWEDMGALAEAHTARSGASATDGRPVLLLPSFPTPNGELHLGHVAGPYLGADIARRALAAAGTPVHLLLGTVGHQSQVAAAAARAGVSFHTLAERNTEAVMAGLAAAGIDWDVFVRPSSPEYPGLARQVFQRLHDDGVVVTRTEPTYHCPRCDRFLFEAFVAGACPHCGSHDTAGIECEACALPFADGDLVDVTCATCGSAAERRPLTRYFLPLEPLRDRLTAYLRTVRMGSRLAGYVDRVLAKPLPDMPVSIVADDGIEVPGADGQRLYSAFELPARYLTAVDRLARARGESGWESYLARHRPRTVLFFGFDNAYLRAILFPAVLGAFTDLAPLPDTLVSNEFYELDGAKFSTGRRHAIWARDAFADKNRDRLRLYLAATRPENRRRNFSTAEYDAFVQRELVERLDGWLGAVGARLAGHFSGAAPEAGGWIPEAEEFYGRIRALHAEAGPALRPERFSPATVVAALSSFVAAGRRFGEVAEDVLAAPGLTGPARTCMALELMAVRTVAEVLRPLAPDAADRLVGQLGGATPAPDPRWVTPGTAVTVSALFS